MSAVALREALLALGLDCEVEAEGAVALVRVPAHERRLESSEVRRAAVRLGAQHGFRNVALEVAD